MELAADDMREALGLPLGSTTTDRAVLDWLVDRAGSRAEGLGTLTIHCGDDRWVLGEGEPEASVRVDDPGELSRVLAARRDDNAVRALEWTGDPDPWVEALPLFREGRD